jgi:tRNA nucleotidyltransferase/poly(A) polymerase/2'-5' RNA ligase
MKLSKRAEDSWFEDDTGKYSVSKLIEAAKDLPAHQVNLTELLEVNAEGLRELAALCKTDADEQKRLDQADYTYPILLNTSGFILDGFHRALKALQDHQDTIPAKTLGPKELGLAKVAMSKRASQTPSIPPEDQKVFDLLLEVARYYKTGAELRVAGGYVRDLLLGKKPKDIDIMVSGSLSGLQFAKLVNRYLSEVKGEDLRNVGVIEARPEQSKQLETAVLSVLGHSIDFVGPRTETYTDESRIPVVSPATPQEDAFRRDLTINSLFLNLQTNQIEDFTGKGVEDLKNGIVRTPTDTTRGINSKHIFLQDPLRLLRAIRFATRLGFAIDHELMTAAKDPEVQKALHVKISRERVQEEVRKMLTGADPVKAMRLIKEIGLWDYVFQKPQDYADWEMDQQSKHHDFTVFEHTMQVLTNLQEILKRRDVSDAQRFVLNMSSIGHDLGKLHPTIKTETVEDGKTWNQYAGHEEVSMKAFEQVLRNLPGTTNEEIEQVKKLIDGARRINPQRCDTSLECNKSRKSLGKFVREMGDLWEAAIELGWADTAGHRKDQFPTHPTKYYDTMKEQIRQYDPKKTRDLKPLLNGVELMAMFGRKGGPWVKALLAELIDAQLETPNLTKEQATELVKRVYQERGLDKRAAELLPGGTESKLRPKDVDPEQLQLGIEVESEHTSDRELAQEIALDHLSEMPDYYTRLRKMETEASVKPALSKRAKLTGAWWFSHNGEVFDVAGIGHAEFVATRKDLFNYEPGEDTYKIAYDAGWVRATRSNNQMNIELSGISDSKLRMIQEALTQLNQTLKIVHVVCDGTREITISYSEFMGALSVAALIKANPTLSKRAKAHTTTGVFLPLPERLARQFPSLGEHDNSKPHCTVLFVGEVPKSKHNALITAVKGVLYDQQPFEVELDERPTYFPASKHSDGCKVAKVGVKSKELRALHSKLLEAVKAAGVKVDDHWPDYKPHVTLSYMDPGQTCYDGKAPSGSFKAAEVELWGCGKALKLPFGRKLSKRVL